MENQIEQRMVVGTETGSELWRVEIRPYEVGLIE